MNKETLIKILEKKKSNLEQIKKLLIQLQGQVIAIEELIELESTNPQTLKED